MPLYEHVFITRQDASAQQVEDLTAQFKTVIEQMGGKIAKTEQWGMKSLAYRLRKNRKAHFTLLNIEAPPAALNEVERQERLSEDVLRYLTVRVREHEEGPSAMMRKVDRDRERDDRGFGFRDRDRDRGGFRDRDRGEYRRDREGSPHPALPPRRRSENDGDVPDADPAAFLSTPQDLPVFRRQCAEDRLQGREAVATLRVRARQDRAQSHHGGFRQEAAGAGARYQARALPRIVALRDPLVEGQRAHDAGRAEQNGRKRGDRPSSSSCDGWDGSHAVSNR
jgi:small subunit ribosomal protein S6